jgi:hypothetical protein
MGGAAAGWLLLLAAEASDLTLPFGEASRPRLCAPNALAPGAEPASSARGASPWDRARQQPVGSLCIALARAQIRLPREPAAALAAARQLGVDWPGRAEPRVLEARALLALGDAAQSYAAWQLARSLLPDSGRELGAAVLSAHALRDYAVAAALSGHADVAADTYRRLVSLRDAWPDRRHVQRLYLEAASASLRRTPPAFDEAAGYLSAAEASASSTGLRAYAAGLHALLRARRGAAGGEPAWLDAPEVWHLVALARAEQRPSHWPRVPRHEARALASLLVERYSSTEAAELWDLYLADLDGSDPALLAFARARQARLARSGRAP